MVEPSDLIEVSPGVYYTARVPVACDERTIEFLKEAARRAPRKRARLCAHPSPEALQHDMLIVSCRDSYVAPHRHLTKTETMLILEGEANTLIFDQGGGIIDTLSMGPVGSKRVFFYRMPERIYHGLLIDSDMLVFVESAKGPFHAGDTENAPWAPEPNNIEDGRTFTDMLRARTADEIRFKHDRRLRASPP